MGGIPTFGPNLHAWINVKDVVRAVPRRVAVEKYLGSSLT